MLKTLNSIIYNKIYLIYLFFNFVIYFGKLMSFLSGQNNNNKIQDKKFSFMV